MPSLSRVSSLCLVSLLSLSLVAAAPAKKKATPAVTSMTFSTSGKLLVGWSDGKLGTIDTRKKRGKLKTLDRKKNAIVAIAPNGKSAVLDAEPATVVETKKGLHLAEASQVSKLEGAAFSADGEHLLISGTDRILVWRDATKLDNLGKKGIKLEEFIARQNGDYSAMLGAMADSIWVLDEGPRVLFANSEGLLTLWDMRNRKEASYIAKIAPPHAVRALHGDLALVASATDHDLHIFRYEDGTKSSWNKTVKADAALGTPRGVVVVRDNILTLHDTDSGEVSWSVELDTSGAPCGMTYGDLSTKKVSRPRVAVCQGGQITVHTLDTGKALSKFVREKSKIKSRKTRSKKLTS